MEKKVFSLQPFAKYLNVSRVKDDDIHIVQYANEELLKYLPSGRKRPLFIYLLLAVGSSTFKILKNTLYYLPDTNHKIKSILQ